MWWLSLKITFLGNDERFLLLVSVFFVFYNFLWFISGLSAIFLARCVKAVKTGQAARRELKNRHQLAQQKHANDGQGQIEPEDGHFRRKKLTISDAQFLNTRQIRMRKIG